MTGKAQFKLEMATAGPLQTNTYLLTCGGESLIIDSGADHGDIFEKLSLRDRKVKALLMTHGHFDHIFDSMDYKNKLGCQLYMSKLERPIMEWSYEVSERYMGRGIEPVEIDRNLEGGQKISLGNSHVDVLWLPGHTPGSMGLLAGNFFFTGDVLFRGTIGRTDIGGSIEDMAKSLEKISSMDQNLEVYPGHGPGTTIRDELESNPYLSGLQ